MICIVREVPLTEEASALKRRVPLSEKASALKRRVPLSEKASGAEDISASVYENVRYDDEECRK